MSLHKFYKIESNQVTNGIVVDSSDCFTDGVYDERKGAAFSANKAGGGTWVGDPADVAAYSGKPCVNAEFNDNKFKHPAPHASFVWNDSSEEWENPVANPEPSNDMVHFNFETGNWVKVEIDSDAGNIQNYNWDGSAWVLDADSVTPYDPASQPPNPYA